MLNKKRIVAVLAGLALLAGVASVTLTNVETSADEGQGISCNTNENCGGGGCC